MSFANLATPTTPSAPRSVRCLVTSMVDASPAISTFHNVHSCRNPVAHVYRDDAACDLVQSLKEIDVSCLEFEVATRIAAANAGTAIAGPTSDLWRRLSKWNTVADVLALDLPVVDELHSPQQQQTPRSQVRCPAIVIHWTPLSLGVPLDM